MAPKKGEETDQALELIKQTIRDIKYRYQYACNRYGCDPMYCITKRLDEALLTGQKFDQVIINTHSLSANQVVALQLCLKLQDIKAFRVWNTIIEPNTLNMICDFIICRNTLKNVDLVGLVIPQPQLIQIPKICLHIQNVIHLSLDHTDISQVSNQVFQALGENVRTSLITLSMRYCHLPSSAAPSISNYLSKTTSLMNLYLCGNQLRDKSLDAFAKFIQTHPSLKQLELSFNEIQGIFVNGTCPFHELCLAVGTSRFMTRLNVSGNFIESSGYESVIEALETRKQLVEAGISPALQIDVPERIENSLFEKIYQLNTLQKGKKKKK